MYELVMYDNGYCFERRWVFSRTLTVSEMMEVLQHSYNDVRYINESLVGDIPLENYSEKVSDYVYLDFRELELSDYIVNLNNESGLNGSN